MLQLSFCNFKKDSYIVVEGQNTADRFYIIQSGHVHCLHKSKVPVSNNNNNILGPGDFIAVIPCLSNHLQIETVIAMTDVVCISVRRDQYPDLIERNTPVAMKIIRTFANKMRLLNENLTKLTLNNVVQESPEQIFASAAYYEKERKFDIAVFGYYQYLKANPRGPNAAIAKQKFIALKPRTKAVYFEPTQDLVRSYPKGTMVFSECQSGAEMYIIQEGSIRITKVVEGQEVILAVLKKGDMFGEMALLENKPRSASAIAHEDCKLMTVNRKNFDQMVTTQPQIISRLTTTLADRLWSMDRQLTNTQLGEPLWKLLDMLELQIEKAKVPLDKTTGYQTDLSMQDLVDMCGLPQNQQPKAFVDFQNDFHVKIVKGKIFVNNCAELAKQAAFYRKQIQK